MVTNTYSVLDTIAGAGDASLANHILTITGMAPIDFRKIESFSYTAYAAGTAGVWTMTPVTGTAGTCNLVITQYVRALGKVVTIPLMQTITATTTQTQICDGWKAQLAASTSLGYTFTANATGAATLILTATGGNNFINVVSTGTVSGGAVNGTPGVAQVGTGAGLVLQYPTVTTTNNYGQYEFVYSYLDLASEAGENALQVKKHVLLANAGSANFSTFNTQVQDLLAAKAPAATNPIEGIAVV